MSLVNGHSTVFFSPAVVSVVANSNLLGGLSNSGSLTEENFRFPELVDDLLWFVSFSDHLFPHFTILYLVPF
jgi:hypothetical protein